VVEELEAVKPAAGSGEFSDAERGALVLHPMETSESAHKIVREIRRIKKSC
jgi:hypothetical protein